MTAYTINAQIRVEGESPEEVIKTLREALSGMQLQEIRIKPAKGRG